MSQRCGRGRSRSRHVDGQERVCTVAWSIRFWAAVNNNDLTWPGPGTDKLETGVGLLDGNGRRTRDAIQVAHHAISKPFLQCCIKTTKVECNVLALDLHEIDNVYVDEQSQKEGYERVKEQ